MGRFPSIQVAVAQPFTTSLEKVGSACRWSNDEDEDRRSLGNHLKAVWGNQENLVELLGQCTAHIERSNLTTRLFSARLSRKSLALSKYVELHEAAVTWEDASYNWFHPYES